MAKKPKRAKKVSERFIGGPDEGAAWTRAFLGAPLPGSTLTAEERSVLNQLLLRAKENGDEEALNRLMELANDPIEFRRVMASFPGEKE